jgi:hypothetical protein
MREAGDVLFTDVFKDGTGVVEYARYEDMKYALKNMDDSKFRSHEVSLKVNCSTYRCFNLMIEYERCCYVLILD